MTAIFTILAVAENGDEPVSTGPSPFGIGSLILIIAVGAVLAWMGYLYVNSRRARAAAPEATPPNLQPYLSDDALENRRLTRVLRAALISAAVLAIVLPIYALDEPDRQAEAAEAFAELDLHFGEELYVEFGCEACHGPGAVGGSAEFIEERSGVATPWSVPSLDDVFFRFSEEEARQVIEFGRKGTPMPPAGLAGGGSMTVQQVDQVMAYLQSVQISQQEALARIDPTVTQAITRVESGDETVAKAIARQEALIEDIERAPEKLEVVGDLPTMVELVLTGDGTCTDESAALFDKPCGDQGQDTDRDGLSDVAEVRVSEAAQVAEVVLTDRNPETLEETAKTVDVEGFGALSVYSFRFDPLNPFTNETPAGEPIPDLDAADVFSTQLQNDVLILNVTTERQETFLADAAVGLEFLQEAAALRLWDVDYSAVAEEMNASVAEATRAAGLFNGYCARCHSGGYSAGTPFEVGAGRGAWGPAINDGRAIVQFPDIEDHIAFVIRGSENAAAYGINGLGTGRMPGFGQILTSEDIELIARYERTL